MSHLTCLSTTHLWAALWNWRGDGRGREETGRQDGWGGLSWQLHGEPITQQVHLSLLLLWIRCDVHRGLLFEPWTHPAKLHHLLPHMRAGARTHTHTTQKPQLHTFSQAATAVRPTWEDFQHNIIPGVSDCLWWCELHPWLQTQDVKGSNRQQKQVAKAYISQKSASSLCSRCRDPPFCMFSY